MEIKFKRDTSFRKQFFVPESFAHPAKMDAQLLIWIVEKYTEPGEVILDSMAGMGTMMLACTLGRDVVLVELEEKFCKMMRDNWDKVKMRPQLGYEMGKCQIIQGDARQLDKLLVDKIISSPPFQEPDVRRKGMSQSRKNYSYGSKLKMSSEHPDNISRLAETNYGSIDKIVTSPPYASGGTKADENPENYIRREEERLKLYPNRPKTFVGRYSGDRGNIGNLPYGEIDKIITSPPYEEAMGKKHHSPRADKLAKEKSNPTTYTEVDSIITSPPYEGSIVEGNENFEGMRHLGTINKGNINQKRAELREYQFGKGKTSYASGSNNIGNLKSQSYLEAMALVYSQCFGVLKNGGLMILVTKNFIRNKQVIRLDTDTIKLCEQAGFEFIERHKRKLSALSFWRITYANKYPELKHLIEQLWYEDVLVLKK